MGDVTSIPEQDPFHSPEVISCRLLPLVIDSNMSEVERCISCTRGLKSTEDARLWEISQLHDNCTPETSVIIFDEHMLSRNRGRFYLPDRWNNVGRVPYTDWEIGGMIRRKFGMGAAYLPIKMHTIDPNWIENRAKQTCDAISTHDHVAQNTSN